MLHVTRVHKVISGTGTDGKSHVAQVQIKNDLQILVCTAVKGSFLQLNLLASTFSPDGPLSSTDDDRHKNKQRKLQKVKVIDKLD